MLLVCSALLSKEDFGCTANTIKESDMNNKDFQEWLQNVSDTCVEHTYDALWHFFNALQLANEFDHAWQWGVFDDWTWTPTPERLEELVDIVREGRY